MDFPNKAMLGLALAIRALGGDARNDDRVSNMLAPDFREKLMSGRYDVARVRKMEQYSNEAENVRILNAAENKLKALKRAGEKFGEIESAHYKERQDQKD